MNVLGKIGSNEGNAFDTPTIMSVFFDLIGCGSSLAMGVYVAHQLFEPLLEWQERERLKKVFTQLVEQDAGGYTEGTLQEAAPALVRDAMSEESTDSRNLSRPPSSSVTIRRRSSDKRATSRSSFASFREISHHLRKQSADIKKERIALAKAVRMAQKHLVVNANSGVGELSDARAGPGGNVDSVV